MHPLGLWQYTPRRANLYCFAYEAILLGKSTYIGQLTDQYRSKLGAI